jgi:serine protease Do
VGVDGRIAGIVQGRSVLAMSDLGVDLKELLADADDRDREEDEEESKGWLGVIMEPINREYARSHGLPKSGLWVVNVAGDSPASACGIREGDLIVGFDGRPLRLSGARAHDYLIKTMRAKPGKPFRVSVMRDGKTLALSGTFAKRPEEASLRADDIGVTVKAITDAEYFGNNLFTREGVLISDIRKGSPAATSSSFGRPLLSRNDVIVELAGRPTRTLDAFGKALEYIRSEKLEIVQVVYWRGRMTGYAGLKLQQDEDGKGGK